MRAVLARAMRLPAPTGFVLRTLFAFALALYVAYAFELDSPYSAGTTVLIVSSSSRGAVLSKGFWRIVGSTIGAAAAVVLMALFAQAPVLFVLGLAAWLGLCTFVSSLLRYFRSYAAVLAGYTVVLVAVGALAHPDAIFILAADRLAVVVIGVVASGIVSMATDVGPNRASLVATLGSLIADAGQLLIDARGTRGGTTLPVARGRIAAGLTSLDQTVEYAAVDDAGFARFARDLRIAAGELFAALTGGPRAAMLLAEAAKVDPDLAEPAREVPALLVRVAGLGATQRGSEDLVRDLRGTGARLLALAATEPERSRLPATSALEQAATLLEQFAVAVEALVALQRGVPRARVERLRSYLNPYTARRNGLRAALAVTIAGLFWIVSQWSAGGTMLAALGPISSLLALNDSASAASVGFFRGMVLAALAAFVVSFGLLPQVTGFPLLLCVMFPFITLGLVGTTRPWSAPFSTPFLIFFVSMCAPDNPQRYDMLIFLNNAAAFVLGAFCGMLTFRILLPPDPVAEAGLLARSIRRDVLRLLRRPPADALVWENLQHQKLVRLGRRLAASPERRRLAIEQAGGAVLIGRRLGQLGRLMRTGALPPPVAAGTRAVLAAMRRRGGLPRAARLAERVSFDIATGTPATPPAQAAATALHDLGALLEQHGRFLAGAPLPEPGG